MSELTKAEVFEKWCSERMGHPLSVNLGRDAVKEQQETIAKQAERIKELESQLSERDEMTEYLQKQLLQKDGEL